MKKERKIKLSKFRIAKINNLTTKGGVNSNVCLTVEPECVNTIMCDSQTSCFDTTCKTTIGTRTGDSLQ